MFVIMSLFLFSLFSLVVDFFYVVGFFLGLGVFFVFWGGGSFSGFFFLDSLSFVLVFLSALVFIYCFFSSMLDFWVSNFFYGFLFFLGSLFFLLFVSFSCFGAFLFYMSFEFLFLLMYLFLLGWGYSPERLQASFYMVFYTVVVSFPFLVCVVYSEEIYGASFGSFLSIPSLWWGFFTLVFLVKLPVYGAHLWLPKAHVEAPVSGSMILAGVLLKLGGYGLIRFGGNLSVSLFLLKGYLVSLGVLGGFLSCILCLRQSDLKAFVAYSSVCHMGFALGGLHSGSSLGLWGGIYMLVGHGFCSSCLFYILFVMYERLHSRSMVILKGLGKVSALLGLVWFIFMILNMGVPPFLSFFSEILILSSLSALSLLTFLFTGVMLFFTGVYGIFLYVICFHGNGSTGSLLSFVSIREHFNFYSHFFYLGFFLFSFNYFF